MAETLRAPVGGSRPADATDATALGPFNPGKRIAPWLPFSREELPRLAGIYGAVALLNVVGWGAFLYYHNKFGPLYAAAGSAAFVFGLRHAFDADHISAVDDTTRYLMQQGKRPLGVGLFFSLGHGTIVMGLSVALALAAEGVQKHIPGLQKLGGTIGAGVSGTFLILIGVLDLLILRGIIEVWKKTKSGHYTREELDDLLSQRGFLNRILGSRWRRFVSDSWQMYPIGVLFGLGFDTASQVALIGLTAAAATGHAHGAAGSHLPFMAIVCLPLLFAGGMTFMDTTNGVVMTRAYSWAFTNPLRKVYYNMATVGLGVFVALGVGMVEYLQVFSHHAGFHGAFWDWVGGLDFEVLGYFIVGTFVLVWIGSMLAYKLFRFEEKYGASAVDPFKTGAAD
jgi:high-affinity nickel-transport protein